MVAFAFRSPGGPMRDELVRRFWDRIGDALCVARGASLSFEWLWASGRHGGAWLRAPDAGATRWISRVVAPAYPPGCWTEESGWRPSSPFEGILRARPRARLDLPLPAVHGASTGWVDGVLRALPWCPSGAEVRWTLTPIPIRREVVGSAPPELELRAVPRDRRLAPIPLRERELRDGIDEHRRDSAWRLEGSISGAPSATRSVVGLIEGLARVPEGNGIRFARSWWDRWPSAPSFVLSMAETLALFPSPLVRFAPWRELGTPGTRFLAVGSAEDSETARLALEPGQGRHLAILGESGMGKSTLLVELATQVPDHAALVLFDPFGDTARRWLRGIPGTVVPRVVWVSPLETPIAINALASPTGPGDPAERAERSRSDLIGTLRRVRESRFRESSFWGPRIEEVLYHALAVAAQLPHGTLRDAATVLEGLGGQHRAVPPNARSSMEWLHERQRDRPTDLEGARRLLSEIVRDSTLGRMLAEPRPRFSFAQACHAGSVLVLSGEADRVGESTVRYLFSVYLSLLWTELLAKPTSVKVVVALDEVQWYAHDSLAELLRLGRRQNVHVWLATQSLDSLSPSVQEAVETNVADLAIFRGSTETAVHFARGIRDLSADTLQSLPRGRFAFLRGKGESVAWVRAATERSSTEGTDRLARVLHSSRRFVPHPIPTAEPDPPREPQRGTPSNGVDRAARQVLLTLAAAIESAQGVDGVVTVRLDDLRRVTDPHGTAVRRVGGELRRAGLLRTSRREPYGPTWEIRTEGFARTLDPPPTESERQEGRTLWRRILGGEAVRSTEKDFRHDSP